MSKKRLLSMVIIALLLVTTLLPNFIVPALAANVEAANEATTVRKGIVTASGLNFRREANTSSKVICVIRKGTEVAIIGEEGDWYRAKYNDEEGYLYKSHVELKTSRGIITATSLNVRSEPTTKSQVIDLVYKGMNVTLVEEIVTGDSANPVWVKISYLDDKVGYVSKNFVKVLVDFNGNYLTTGTTTATWLNMRSEASVFSKILTSLKKGTPVIILEEKHTSDTYKLWYKVQSDGQTGWIAGKYLEIKDWVLVSTASTNSPSSGSNRNTNMKLAGRALTGTIVMPGEKFSWCNTMGSCSAAKGYKIATVYINGKVDEGTGGGVCQVSTTFNMAVKKAGIPTNASQHSLPVSYAKREDEASVSYPYLDFSFTNTLTTPILIEFVTNNGKVTCNIYTAEKVDVSETGTP